MDDRELVRICKTSLLQLCTADAILRSRRSLFGQHFPAEADHIIDDYFATHERINLKEYVKARSAEFAVSRQNACVLTLSSISVDAAGLVESSRAIRLGWFRTEAELREEVAQFYAGSASWLFVQCDPIADASNLLLTKTIIDEFSSIQILPRKKVACLILHIHREMYEHEGRVEWQFPFGSGLDMVTIDSLNLQPVEFDQLTAARTCRLLDLFENDLSFDEAVEQQVMWCYRCIRFPSDDETTAEHIRQNVATLTAQSKTSSVLRSHLRRKVFELLNMKQRNKTETRSN